MKNIGEVELRNIVNNAVDGIIAINEQGLIEAVNPAVERIFGYKEEELIGQNVKMLMPEPYHSEHDAYLKNYRETGVKKIIGIGREVVGRRKDGTTFPLDLAVSEVQFDDHRVFTGVVRDISDRRESERALRDSELRHRAILETVIDGIITIDENGTIESANPAAERLFGYTSEEMKGKNVKMLMPEPYRGEHDQYLRNYRDTGIKKIIGIGREVIGQRKNGDTFPMDLAVSEVKLGDKRRFTGIVRDITERKASEAKLREAMEKAEQANAAKDHFLAVVSHELRTPLNPILATASLLERSSELPQSLRGEIAVIRRSVQQEARMVDDLLNLTRLQRNKIDLHQEVLNVHAAIHHSIAQFQRDIDQKQIDLLISLRAARYHVWADPGRIEQVLANLFSNAIKFTSGGGQITIRTTNSGEERVRIDITDTGIGIEPEIIPLLFKPFEQGERTTSRKFGGLGLGLVISKGIVDLHGGSLSVQSHGRDKGTTFTLELKALPVLSEQETVASASAPPPTVANRNGRTVLLVEDHEDTLRVMAKLIQSVGFNVLLATSMAEAIDVIAREKIDILVSDIGLPDGSGLTVMQRLKQKQPDARGIAMSGFGLDEDIRKSREAGFLDHLIKPVNFPAVENALRTITHAA